MMRRTATALALALVVVGLGLVGCGPRLGKPEAESLILDYAKQNCQMTVLYSNPVDIDVMTHGSKPVEIPIRWLLDQLHNSPDFKFVSQTTIMSGLYGQRFRGADGWDYYVEEAPPQSFAILYTKGFISNFQGCMYRPMGAEVLDITPDDDNRKHVTVVVKFPRQDPTLFGKAVLSSDVAPQVDPAILRPHLEQEFEAKLEKFDEGGWRVASLAPRSGN